MNALPFPRLLSTVTVPAIFSAACLTIDQTQARAAGLARARLVHAIKTLENAWQILEWNADPGVADLDPHLVAHQHRLQPDFTAGPVEADAVVQQIHQRVFQAEPLAHHVDILDHAGEDIHVGAPRPRFPRHASAAPATSRTETFSAGGGSVPLPVRRVPADRTPYRPAARCCGR